MQYLEVKIKMEPHKYEQIPLSSYISPSDVWFIYDFESVQTLSPTLIPILNREWLSLDILKSGFVFYFSKLANNLKQKQN